MCPYCWPQTTALKCSAGDSATAASAAAAAAAHTAQWLPLGCKQYISSSGAEECNDIHQPSSIRQLLLNSMAMQLGLQHALVVYHGMDPQGPLMNLQLHA